VVFRRGQQVDEQNAYSIVYYTCPINPFMKRRNFILIGAAGVAAVSVPSAFYFFRDIEYDKSLADPGSLLFILDGPAVVMLGEQYRILFPGEDSERFLARKLSADAPDLQNIIINDFETENTVLVDGWILSKTEARQCALFSIINKK
jgi:hypothetical protein